jgi:prepilin-type processing-associated H-X9-DG protein
MHARQLTKRDTGVAVVTTLFVLCTVSVVGLSGRERAKQAVCLANVKQLGQAWLQYADDNDGKIVNGEAYASGDGTCPTPPVGMHAREKWWMGDDCASNYMVGGKLAKETQIQAIRAGALFPYCGTENLYHCPGGVPGAVRTYSIVDSMNGPPRTGTYKDGVGVKVGETVLWVKKKSEITVPEPALRLVFLDMGQPMPNSYAVWYLSALWWDPAPVRHDNGTNVCFADGHCEYWRWEAAETVAIGTAANSPHNYTPVTPEGTRDLQRMQTAVWGRLGY